LGIEETIISWFQEIAYNPPLVYSSIICLMVASSFGFPLPEEATLVSAGFLAYMAMNPAEFPPPPNGGQGVNVHTIAVVSLVGVIASDYLIFWLGRRYGPALLKIRLVRKAIHPKRMEKVTRWVKKYGSFAPALFRFTPGARFPGHFACGLLGLSTSRFLLVGGLAALVSVPTQIYLVAFYGKTILETFRNFQAVVLVLLVIFLVIFVIRRRNRAKERR
jgi:membrane protein DedA with SNARE-associated domain